MTEIIRRVAPKEELRDVMREYEETLIIPERTLNPQWMLMPVGLIGSGKTPIVKSLAEYFGLVRISTDEIRQIMKKRGHTYDGVRDIVQEIIQKYLGLGYSLACDANTGSRFGLKYNKKTKRTFPDVPHIFIHINPPDEYIINKLKNYTHTWLFKDVTHAINSFYKNKKEFIVPDIPFAFTFDPSRSDFRKHLKEGIKALESALSVNKNSYFNK